MERDDGFMNWVDRMREHMDDMAEKAQDAQRVGQAKWSVLQAKRQYEALAQKLGEVTYLQQVEGDTVDRSEAARELIAQMRDLEGDNQTIDLRDHVIADQKVSH